MDNKHIIDLIESTPLAEISESDLTMVRAHTLACASCKRAFEAAEITSYLLQERAAATFEPSPFFETRVLAVLRERQAANEQWSWSRIWRATGALASSMVAAVAALAVLTFISPATPSGADFTSLNNAYSAEAVILNDSGIQSDEQISDGQVLNTLYESEEDTVK